MEGTMPPKKVLMHQSIGFVAIIALSWVNESLNLRSLILGDHPYISDFRESTLEMLFVLAIWLIVCGSTRRILARVNHLEGFMRVCSWCRKIGSDGHWVPLEEYMATNFHTPTSHGICEECLRQQEAAVERMQHQCSGTSPTAAVRKAAEGQA
jgi:hypothetical protein